MSSVVRLLIFVIVFTLLSVCAFGQDLGSSNKLFGGSKTSTAKKTAKKTPAKRKPAASKPKTVAQRHTPTPKKAVTTTHKPGQTTTAVKPKTTDTGKSTTSKVDTPPTKASIPPGLTGAAADDLFEELIEKGNTARDDRNYSAAEASYRRATTIKPKDARAVYGLGNLYVDQERWEDGETAYRTALQLDPNNAVAHIALSYVLIQPLAVANLSDRYEEAEKLARRAIQLAPWNALAFDQMGVALELRGLIGAETETAYRRSIQLDPSFAPAYAHLGRLLRRRGLTSESATAYQDAIRRSTDVATMILGGRCNAVRAAICRVGTAFAKGHRERSEKSDGSADAWPCPYDAGQIYRGRERFENKPRDQHEWLYGKQPIGFAIRTTG